MKRFTPFFIICLALISWCSEAKADLVLAVDTANEILYFTGDATGTTSDPDEWVIGMPGFALPSSVSISPAIDGASGQLFVTPEFVGGDGSLLLTLSPDSSVAGDTVTYSGNGFGDGFTVSYAALFDNEKDFLESQIGSSLVLSSGSGFGNVSIVAAVPEPTSGIVLCAALTVLAIRRKRS